MRILIAISLLLICTAASWAETYVYANTYGAPLLPADAAQVGMGGAGSASTDGGNNALGNPAALALMKNSRFVLNAARLRSDYKTDKGHGVYNDYTIPWFSLNMATNNGFGAAVGYAEEYEGNFQAWADLYDGDEVIGRREVWGKGTVPGYWGAVGFKLSKDISLGARAIYYYGTIGQQWKLHFYRKDYLYSEYRLSSQRQGVGGNLGVLWQQSPKLALGLNLTAPAYLAATDVDWAGTREYYRSNDKITYPPSALLGLNWQAAERTQFNLDVNYALWSMARYTVLEPSAVRDSFSIRTGGQWYPLPPSGNFLSNFALRGGLYFSQGYPNDPGHRFNEMGLTMGTGYRFSENEDSKIDGAVAIGLRNGQSSADERLFRVWVSFVGLENWFFPPPEEE
jgi:long-subunit fatty acid transport protein